MGYQGRGRFRYFSEGIARRKAPNYDAACFHAQQMAEKYLKAYMQSNNIAPPRSHDLIELLAICLPFNSSLVFLEPALKSLNAFAVQFRYPGQSAERGDARAALNSAKMVRTQLRLLLNAD
jgi:HEPN domain-containing protein